jgi:hypothetical protein
MGRQQEEYIARGNDFAHTARGGAEKLIGDEEEEAGGGQTCGHLHGRVYRQ